jgi:hypothetical protein
MSVQYSHPKVGSKIRVTYRARDIYFKAEHEFVNEWVDGIVLPNHKFVDPNAFVLRVNCQMSPIREINLKNVVDIQYFDGSVAEMNDVDNTVKTLEVTGSKGEKYIVVKEGRKVTCTCPGFTFRRVCRHLALIK